MAPLYDITEVGRSLWPEVTNEQTENLFAMWKTQSNEDSCRTPRALWSPADGHGLEKEGNVTLPRLTAIC